MIAAVKVSDRSRTKFGEGISKDRTRAQWFDGWHYDSGKKDELGHGLATKEGCRTRCKSLNLVPNLGILKDFSI
jgi:hypothetical protein